MRRGLVEEAEYESLRMEAKEEMIIPLLALQDQSQE